jgi:murein DD-endopeptidase MepM/ murein hydrolase activator NlpD
MMTLFFKRTLIVALTMTLSLSSYSAFSPTVSANEQASSKGELIAGQQYVGKSIKGFDSGDFVSYVFNKENVNVPSEEHSLTQQGKKVSKSDLEPGDLLFFGTSPRQLKAVAIYTGNNEFVTAYPPYEEIKKMNLDSVAAKKYYLGAKRVTMSAPVVDLPSYSVGKNTLQNGIFPLKKGTYKYRNNFGDLRTWTPNGPKKRSHEGIDIKAPNGTPIYSATDGKIVRYGWNYYGGWRLTISVGNNTTLYYAHLDRYAPGLSEGKTVKKGQLLGYVGKTGYGPVGTEGKRNHLHFGIYKNGSAINPYPYLKKWEQNN